MRSKGEGSVYVFRRDEKGRPVLYAAAMTVGHTETRKRKVRVVYAKTEKAVVEKLLDLRQSAKTGTLADVNSLTVEGWMTRWLEVKKTETRATTHARYTLIFEHQ